MLKDLESIPALEPLTSDICIVGSGPAGITLALELESSGKFTNIIILESGEKKFSEKFQNLSHANILDKKKHADMHEAVRIQLGGTSNIWGGRCVPYDRVDFINEAIPEKYRWPIEYDEIEKHYKKACEYCSCGNPDFSPKSNPTTIAGEEGGIVTTVERWSNPVNFWSKYQRDIISSKIINVIYNATVVNLNIKNDSIVESVSARTINRNDYLIKSNTFIICCGGIETTRLMLAANEKCNNKIGNKHGNVGKYYMGHISGKIATIQFNNECKIGFGYYKDENKVYCRKRIAIPEQLFSKHNLLNFTAWLDHPVIYDYKHRNGILSLAYLSLLLPFFGKKLVTEAIRNAAVKGVSPSKKLFFEHIKNIVFDAHKVMRFIPLFVFNKYFVKRRVPGIFVHGENNEYALHYHAEHLPNINSKITLGAEKDKIGRKIVDVDIKYSETDINNVIKCHKLIDELLRANNFGKLVYHNKNLKEEVVNQARDGYHQLGTTRMSNNNTTGVVDRNCKVNDVQNLYICSSSVFSTSGQANPTLTIVALAIRLAEHLK